LFAIKRMLGVEPRDGRTETTVRPLVDALHTKGNGFPQCPSEPGQPKAVAEALGCHPGDLFPVVPSLKRER